MELHELIRMITLINRLAKRALFAEEQIVALEGQCAEWKRIADELKAERNAAKQEAVSARQDAVQSQPDYKVGDWVRRKYGRKYGVLSRNPHYHAGAIGKVVTSHDGHGGVNVSIPGGACVYWAINSVEPCDPPQEASHDTPEGKRTAEGAVEPKPGDVVRLVRVPTLKEYPHDWEPNWGGIDDHMRVHYVGSNITGIRVVRAVFGLEWPVSCVEVVKGADK